MHSQKWLTQCKGRGELRGGRKKNFLFYFSQHRPQYLLFIISVLFANISIDKTNTRGVELKSKPREFMKYSLQVSGEKGEPWLAALSCF